ncbi:MAG: hypothetical protein IH830_03040 [Planctomycetes bacterium]|nr:hypothetical protein [Planctomycetota bacterium]
MKMLPAVQQAAAFLSRIRNPADRGQMRDIFEGAILDQVYFKGKSQDDAEEFALAFIVGHAKCENTALTPVVRAIA